ncbi:MAG: hypothetical protein OHK0036_20500 [Bacteroidia bacterium]
MIECMWFDYDRVFGPSALINCKKNTRECVGFHHDYQGKIRNSGLIEFYIVKEGPIGIYGADWSYCDASLKRSTFFPDEWAYRKVLEKIFEASKNIQSYTYNPRNSTWIIKGITTEKIIIEIVLEADIEKNPTGKIVSGYPILEY